MSEPASKFEQFGLDRDPFSTTIADEAIASQYSTVGRDDQEYRLREFVRSGIRDPDLMKRRLIFGEYGTGKSHHLIELRDEVRGGVEIDDQTYEALAVYVGNLGLSIRRLYEKIVEELIQDEPALGNYIDGLPSIEPEDSVDEAYRYERLQDNIATQLRKIITKAREDFGYRAVFLFIDEAEDIAAETDEQKVQQFIRSFLHLVNELNTSGLHMLLGFSQGARVAITDYEEGDDSLGNALVQRFQGDDIYLGDLAEDDIKKMLIDRMDVHRTSGKGELAPIVEETVGVVTEVTGGHPRSILQIYSEALNFAATTDADRIDGDAIVYALTDFTSLVRDEVLLSSEALTSLKQALEDAHSEARDDFERLEGRLIGEAEAIPESAFSKEVPEALMSPITIESDDGGEIRVLEKREQHGRYSYVLSDEAKDFLFRGQSDEGTEIQKLDIQATTAPDKYQGELSRGLALSLREDGHGSLHKDPVTVPYDRYEFAAYLIDVDRGAGKRKQTVAVGVYNGQEIPAELIELFIEAYESRGASFGALIKENQQQSAEANKYLNELKQHQRKFYTDRVVEINLSTAQRDSFIYGRLLAIGDSDIDSEGMVESHSLISEISLVDDLRGLFDDTILPYPSKVHRKVIDHLEKYDNAEFTISDLRDELDVQNYDLNADIMGGLRDQNLVAKSGQRWVYPDIENDDPPWYEIYRIVNEKGALTVDELREQLTQTFVLGCPPSEENAMLQWYLDHLQRQNYLERTEISREGTVADGYCVVSVEDQFSEARARAQDRLDAAEESYHTAETLNVSNANTFKNTLEDLSIRLEKHEEVFNPKHEDLNAVRDLIDDIVSLEEDLEAAVEDRQEVIIGEAKTVRDSITDIQAKIEQADIEGSFASQLSDLQSELEEDLDDELESLIENEQHERLLKRSDAIDARVKEIDSEVEDLIGFKTKATELFKELTEVADEGKNQIEDLADQNEARGELLGEHERIEEEFDNYRDKFNAGEYEAALSILETIESDVRSLKNEARQIKTQQNQFLSQLDDLEPEISAAEGQAMLEDARDTVREGDFATAPKLIDEVEDYVTGPTRREQFIDALATHDDSLVELIEETDFDTVEAFDQLESLYMSQDSQVADITVVMNDE